MIKKHSYFNKKGIFYCIYLMALLIFPDWLCAVKAKPIVISLGSDCHVAERLNHYQLRDAAYPFDWVILEDFDSVTDVIEDYFQHWLDPNFLEYRGKQIFNKYYCLSFVHDFPIVGCPTLISSEGDHSSFGIIDPNFIKFIPQAAEKFERRISRFFSVLSSNNPVIFIRANATFHSAQRFVKLIKTKYPNLPFLLVVVCPPKLIDNTWNIENVKNFYALDSSERFGWWWGDKTWNYVLKEIKLIK